MAIQTPTIIATYTSLSPLAYTFDLPLLFHIFIFNSNFLNTFLITSLAFLLSQIPDHYYLRKTSSLIHGHPAPLVFKAAIFPRTDYSSTQFLQRFVFVDVSQPRELFISQPHLALHPPHF